jgi:hypothetical protein
MHWNKIKLCRISDMKLAKGALPAFTPPIDKIVLPITTYCLLDAGC